MGKIIVGSSALCSLLLFPWVALAFFMPDNTNRVVELGGVRLELIWCPPGSFVMGSPTNEMGRFPDEAQHRVTLTQGFWLGKCEVTQRQWEKVMRGNPSDFSKDPLFKKSLFKWLRQPKECSRLDRPVECVSWDDAIRFCQKVTERERKMGRLPEDFIYTLPTEAQWEYACRAESETPFCCGVRVKVSMINFDGSDPYAGKDKECGKKETTPVGQFSPNAWGFFDMHGNVWEWCRDWYGPCLTSPAIDPVGPSVGERRITRGGAWDEFPRRCRSAVRGMAEPTCRINHIGFRIALAQISDSSRLQ